MAVFSSGRIVPFSEKIMEIDDLGKSFHRSNHSSRKKDSSDLLGRENGQNSFLYVTIFMICRNSYENRLPSNAEDSNAKDNEGDS